MKIQMNFARRKFLVLRSGIWRREQKRGEGGKQRKKIRDDKFCARPRRMMQMIDNPRCSSRSFSLSFHKFSFPPKFFTSRSNVFHRDDTLSSPFGKPVEIKSSILFRRLSKRDIHAECRSNETLCNSHCDSSASSLRIKMRTRLFPPSFR